MFLLLAKFFRWCATRFAWFLLIVATLVLGHFLSGEYRKIASQISSVNDFRSARTQLVQFIEDQGAAVNRESRELRIAAEFRLQSRLNEIDREIALRKEETKSPLRSLLANGVNAPRTLMEARIRLTILEQQRPYVEQLLNVAIATRGLAAAREWRAQLLSRHVDIYRKLQDAKRRLATFEEAHLILAHIPFTAENVRLGELEDSRDELLRRNQAAARAVKGQDTTIARLNQLPRNVSDFHLDRGPIQPILDAIDAEIANREQLRDSNWAAKLMTPIQAVIPTAIVILASLILAPLLVKSFLFFVVAPMAARRPPVRLLTPALDAAAALHTAASAYADPVTVSEVSKTLVVDELHELIVHPEFLQSFSIRGDKRTKWLLDWRFPISSLMAGMYALTRVRTASTESVVISDATDPLGEIGVLAVPEGLALVFQPHSLVGVMQLRERPIRVTRHWRLGSLTAWLTLQLRYLVFHGPATLIVTGCRGIRIEPAGRGRSLDQSATIGFCANLDYSVSRCATFVPYLVGKQGLFNDSFAGGPGYYIYEETPHLRKRSGVTGRGLEGLTDAVLKLFGI